ncbi:hypothetical protein B9Z19DRAFT_1104250 [Tuber borchii]|uniref:Cyanovirin-N domain-containing protein n=1 Tax=Tuber borchii TaxID=42251 RepID=A0A2T6ZB98_TUBBO|nr:hypothetical protein B9Z19DRAFT_1104250 [Tuber borchii]
MFSLLFAILIVPSLLPSTLCVPHGVWETIRPPGTSPPGCIDSYPGPFSFQPVDHPTPGIETHCMKPRTLRAVLQHGVLTDHLGRIGSISLCPDNLIALGPQKQFYGCACGDKECHYDMKIADYCRPIFLKIVLLVEC